MDTTLAPIQGTIFISYATVDAVQAKALCQYLEAQQLACWFAPRMITGGADFADEIINGIEQCQLMLLLVTPASVASPHVLREVNHAIGRRMHILPVRTEDFQLTKAMAYYLSHVQWIDAFPEPLESYYADIASQLRKLTTHTGVAPQPIEWSPNRIVAKRRSNIWLATAVMMLLAVSGIATGLYLHGNTLGQTGSAAAFTEKQLGVMERMALDVANTLSYIDITIDGIIETTRLCTNLYDHSLRNGINTTKQQELLQWINHKQQQFHDLPYTSTWNATLVAEYPEKKYHMQDLATLFDNLMPSFRHEVDEFYELTRTAIEHPDGWLDEQRRVFELRQEYFQESSIFYYYGCMDIFAEYPREVQKDTDKILLGLRHMPGKERPDASRAQQLTEASLQKHDQIAMQLATLVGNESRNLRNQQQQQQRVPTSLQDKVDKIAATQAALHDTEGKLAENYTAIRAKCTLSPTDEPGLMWGKIMRLMAMKMYDDALTQLDNYQRFNSADPFAPRIAQTAKAYAQTTRATGLQRYGAMVAAIENNATHSALQPGDIILTLNGQQVMGADSYYDIKKHSNGQIRTYSYLRLNDAVPPALQEHHATGNPGDPRIGLGDMVEKVQ